MIIGEVTALIRHPIKSFAGENVNTTKVMSYGLYGDRSHAFVDLDRGNKFLTITQFPKMATYQARFVGEDTIDSYPPIKIVDESGNTYFWGDKLFKEELEELTSKKLESIQYTPEYVPFPSIEEENILLVSENSLNDLETEWGSKVDYKRFRGNIIFSLDKESPYTEEELIGKTIKIGNQVKLKINKYCERCMIITVDPETGNKQPTLLKTIVKERNNHFGVYASVLETGDIQVGDTIQVME